MKIINLLPKEELKELKLEQMAGQVMSFWMSTLVILGILFALGLGSNLLLTQKISHNNNEIENKKQTLRSSATQQLEQEVSKLNSQIALIDSLRKDHYYWSKALAELNKHIDTDTILTSVQMERTTNKIRVDGIAGDRDSVLAFWASVKKSSMFTDINFPLTNLEKDLDANFTFTFYVKPEALKE